MAGQPHVHIGVSGWTYPPWRGGFYPPGLRQREELAFAARALTSIEINGSFYALQKPDSYARWHDEVPEEFVFALKAPRFITHIRRLRDAGEPLANFLASGPLRLGAKLGPILWQLPPSFRFEAERLRAFLALLPHDTAQAAHIAQGHDGRVGDGWCRTDATRPLRHAMEIRHASFAVPEFFDLLRAHGVALVLADTVTWPKLDEPTADFTYCRLHGDAELYASGYDAAALDAWAARVRTWRKAGRDVFVYFDNTLKTRAPVDAQALIARVADRR